MSDRVMTLTTDELREIGKLTVALTQCRQSGCKHLSVENFAPDLFHDLLSRYMVIKQGVTLHHYEAYLDAFVDEPPA